MQHEICPSNSPQLGTCDKHVRNKHNPISLPQILTIIISGLLLRIGINLQDFMYLPLHINSIKWWHEWLNKKFYKGNKT